MREQVRLSPTLWRTCRALANRRRLRVIQYLAKHPLRTVSELAAEMRWPLAVTSQYLRALGARGLLEAQRSGRHVFYGLKSDPSVSHAGPLAKALAKTFAEGSNPIEEAFAALTGFTHPRRIAIVRALGREVLELAEIRRRTRINTHALLRHLKKLRKRGYVVKEGRYYRCGRTASPLASTLLDLARRPE